MKVQEIIKKVLLLIIILIGVLAVYFLLPSGWGRASKKENEAINFSCLKSIAGVIQKVQDKQEVTMWSWDMLEEIDTSPSYVKDNMYEYPSKTKYRIYEQPKGSLGIVISGSQLDEFGMLWGITKDGIVIKYLKVK